VAKIAIDEKINDINALRLFPEMVIGINYQAAFIGFPVIGVN
jgi:hypothetical protein